MATRYKLAVVTFIDILGFGEYVRSGATPQKIKGALNLLKESSEFETPTRRVFNQRFTNFSDTIVRTTPIVGRRGQANDFGILFNEVLAMVYLQSWLIYRYGLCVRGCIDIGEVVHTNSHLFGPGVISAYEFEKARAIYPRIILAPALMQAYRTTPHLKSDIHTHAEDREYLRQIVRKDQDGLYFVDYLHAFEEECDYHSEYLKFAHAHRTHVVSQLQQHRKGTRARIKMEWLKGYHNHTMNRFPPRLFATVGKSRTDFVVP